MLDLADFAELDGYDIIVVAFSGGKDSMALVLWLLEMGVDPSRIELHHHLVDGNEGSELFDWPVTEAFCRVFAAAFGIPIYFSWKEGGFEREMTRTDQATAPILWENPDGSIGGKGGDGPAGTRNRFPQISASLSVRWCSSYLKIDVMSRVINNSERFVGVRTLVLSGERGEESKARGCYAKWEPDRSDCKGVGRYVDRMRPIRDWTEAQVWAIIERWKVRPHPCYYLGWGRCSCRFCIFGSSSQFKSAAHLDPDGFQKLVDYEQGFGCKLKRKESLPELVVKGEVYLAAIDPGNEELKAIIMGREFPFPAFVEDWKLPAGAYGESNGPT